MGITTNLAHHFLEAVDQAAIASAAWRGKGDKNAADDAAVEAMRRTFDAVPFDGRVAIGEGERDEAPMLYIGEELGSMVGHVGAPQIDIAVDPLECTNNCADNQPNSIAGSLPVKLNGEVEIPHPFSVVADVVLPGFEVLNPVIPGLRKVVHDVR